MLADLSCVPNVHRGLLITKHKVGREDRRFIPAGSRWLLERRTLLRKRVPQHRRSNRTRTICSVYISCTLALMSREAHNSRRKRLPATQTTLQPPNPKPLAGRRAFKSIRALDAMCLRRFSKCSLKSWSWIHISYPNI